MISPSTITSEPGASTALGNDSTRPCRTARVHLGRDPQPSAGIVDSQSVKTTGIGGEAHGYDPGKRVKGRKRHLLVDTQGLVLKAKVHAASVFDRDGTKPLVELVEERFLSLSHLCLDAGYNGKGGREGVRSDSGGRATPKSVGVGSRRPRASALAGFHSLAEEMGGGEDILLDRPDPQAELRDYEKLTATSEAFVYVAMTRLMASRLARS